MHLFSVCALTLSTSSSTHAQTPLLPCPQSLSTPTSPRSLLSTLFFRFRSCKHTPVSLLLLLFLCQLPTHRSTHKPRKQERDKRRMALAPINSICMSGEWRTMMNERHCGMSTFSLAYSLAYFLNAQHFFSLFIPLPLDKVIITQCHSLSINCTAVDRWMDTR